MAIIKKKLSVWLSSSLITRMEREALRKHWDIDLVLEEAIIAYLESEKPLGTIKKKRT